jgi:uncharacterized heparinase superfamily protein
MPRVYCSTTCLPLAGIQRRPVRILIKLSARKLYQKLTKWRRRLQVRLESKAPADNLQEVNDSAFSLHSGASKHPVFYWDNRDLETIVRTVAGWYCETISPSISDADEVCDHVFDLLGSGKIHVGNIDWNRDFKSGYCWSPGFYADIVQVPANTQAEVKVPRELSRCHHFLTLGRAYVYTNDKKYAREFVAQLADWIQKNPPRMTINWCSAMDVAIRLVNWIWAYHFFIHSPHFDEDSKKKLVKSLLTHAEFVYENLEYYGELSDNHYVSNVVGLVFVGILFAEFRQAKKWQRAGLKGIFNEIISQVHEDGVHFEGSINYHRLVLEMFVSAFILCMRNDLEIPDAAWQRLEKMFEFVLHYLRPDGSAPQIGDTDNGRLQVLSSDNAMDHRYLLAVGAVLFQRPDFKAGAGSFPEEALWMLGLEGLNKFDALNDEVNPLRSKGFPQSGCYFMRHNQLYMAVRCAPNGRRGVGNHSHNDALSFELYAYDKSFIVDPGTYVYTPEPKWRNLFRSTAYHNTLVVDDEEINRIPDDLFRLMNDTSPVVNRWETMVEADFLDAQHNGYERLHQPVTHRRQFYFDKIENCWLIRDLIVGKGKHALSWYFHFDAGIDLRMRDGITVETRCPKGANLILQAQDGPPLNLELEQGWVSPSYGIRKRAPVARYSCTVELPRSVIFILYPYMGQAGSLSIPNRIVANATACWGTAS